MRNVPFAPWARLAVAVLALLAASGCSKKLRHLVLPNQLPQVRVTAAPIDTTSKCDPDPVRSCYLLTLHWV